MATPNYEELQANMHRRLGRVDDEGWTHGYCDPEGNFLGYASYMTLIPNLIPARRHCKSGIVEPTGNQRILPKGGVIMTDAGFGAGGADETVMTGMQDDKGGGLAPTGAIPGTALPTEDEKPAFTPSPELAARIASRNTAKAEAKPKGEPKSE